MRSDDPELKIPAIKRAVADHDQTDVPQMVRDLDDPDPAVRFYAGQGLQRLTGDDFGYRSYDEAERRAPAIHRWQAWLAGQHRPDDPGV